MPMAAPVGLAAWAVREMGQFKGEAELPLAAVLSMAELVELVEQVLRQQHQAEADHWVVAGAEVHMIASKR